MSGTACAFHQTSSGHVLTGPSRCSPGLGAAPCLRCSLSLQLLFPAHHLVDVGANYGPLLLALEHLLHHLLQLEHSLPATKTSLPRLLEVLTPLHSVFYVVFFSR